MDNCRDVKFLGLLRNLTVCFVMAVCLLYANHLAASAGGGWGQIRASVNASCAMLVFNLSRVEPFLINPNRYNDKCRDRFKQLDENSKSFLNRQNPPHLTGILKFVSSSKVALS